MAKKSFVLKVANKSLKNRAKIIGNKLLGFINEGDSILDFGCGEMSISKYIGSQKSVSVTGIDTSNYFIKEENYIKYEGGRLPFDDNKFDVVMAIFVLHHTSDLDFYLKELIRVSKNKIIICEDTYVNKKEEIFTKYSCYFSNILIGSLDMKRNFMSVSEWKDFFTNYNVKLQSFERFYPSKLKFPFIRNVIIELKKD